MLRLTLRKRYRVFWLLVSGVSQMKVARPFNVAESTVPRFMRRVNDTGRFTDHPRSGVTLMPTAHLEIREDIQKLQDSGVNVEISWTPGHSNIQGNELADRLAKEAAEEAKETDMKDLPPVLSMNDIKTAVNESVKKKWQKRWEIAEKGRHLFSHRPVVDYKMKHTFVSKTGERVISQLRTGYVRLNEYLYKCNMRDDNKCHCGSIETVSHYLIKCEIYESQREKMRKNLYDRCGIIHLDANLLLGAREDDDYKTWRSVILSELETFVVETGRFTTQNSN